MHPLILAGFCAMRGLAVEDEHPPRASRPFDATRAGFVIGEGACVLLLEELEAARARGATVYAEVLGYGASNDAHHMAQPEPEATGVAEMMRAALRRAASSPSGSATSTPTAPRRRWATLAETRAIKQVFGDHAYDLAVSSTKSMIGHCFGAAGAIEAMMCVLALHHGVLPPTINYEHPDPECDLDYVPNEAREAEVDVALSNAMGLGGHNGCVLLGRARELRRRPRRRGLRRGAHRAARRACSSGSPRRRSAKTTHAPDDGRPARGPLPRASSSARCGRGACSSSAPSPATPRSAWRSALPAGGRIITLDVNEETTEIARRYATEAGVVDRIDYRVGPASETMAELDGPFDLSSSTPTRTGYVDYYEAALPMLADGGLIVADNVLWSGRVASDDPTTTRRARSSASTTTCARTTASRA